MPLDRAADLAALADLARHGGLDLSDVTLRVKADLLIAMPEPPQEDIAAFVEMATSLIPQVETQTAVILARKLAGWPHAPLAVLQALQARGAEVRAALIQHGLSLSHAEKDAIATGGDGASRTALATRRDLSSSTMIVLAGLADRAIDLALVGNGGLDLPRAALDLLSMRARHDPALAARLVAREDIPASEITPLFLVAAPERRSAMLDALAAIEAVSPSPAPRAPLPEIVEGWLALADDDHAAAFAAIATHVGGGHALARALAEDTSRDLAALTLIGAGLTPEEATRFLIRLGDDAARSVGRIFAIVDLMRAIHPGVARRLAGHIAGVQLGAEPRAGRHQPAMAPSGTPERANATPRQGRLPESRVLDRLAREG